jgi:hypothetical protein
MILKPKDCCPMGSHGCQVLMPIAGRARGNDLCISDIVAALNAAGLETAASCCGHGEAEGRVDLADGRVLTIAHTSDLVCVGDTNK